MCSQAGKLEIFLKDSLALWWRVETGKEGDMGLPQQRRGETLQVATPNGTKRRPLNSRTAVA